MKYLLNQKEMQDLEDRASTVSNDLSKTIENLCRRIANKEPSWLGWDGKDQPSPWGCIKDSDGFEWYCDQCPVQDICPYDAKQWSK